MAKQEVTKEDCIFRARTELLDYIWAFGLASAHNLGAIDSPNLESVLLDLANQCVCIMAEYHKMVETGLLKPEEQFKIDTEEGGSIEKQRELILEQVNKMKEVYGITKEAEEEPKS